jgi:putative colanic acid biosynthesis acetyltransferase WcaF
MGTIGFIRMTPTNDIDANRKSRKWSRKELLGRLLWKIVSPLFCYSPRLCWNWRCFLLRCFGARIGNQVRIDPSVRIFIPWNLSIDDWSCVGFDVLIYNLGPLAIAKRVTISQRAHLCGGTHDYRDSALPLVKSTITIGDGAWICADAFIGPDVTIGRDCIVGARGVVVKNVEPFCIVAGNPARKIGERNSATD